jgi:hypothetical protein
MLHGAAAPAREAQSPDPLRALEDAARVARAAGHESHKLERPVAHAFEAQAACNAALVDAVRFLAARVRELEALLSLGADAPPEDWASKIMGIDL